MIFVICQSQDIAFNILPSKPNCIRQSNDVKIGYLVLNVE